MSGYGLKDLLREKKFEQKKKSLDKILKNVLPDMQKVEKCIQENLDSPVRLIRQVSNYLLGSGGKRIRPLILILVARIGGYSGDRAIKLGTAIEFIHTATLLHDDIIDNSSTRRGFPSANSKWGNEVSVLVGDYLYSKAITIFTNDNDSRLLPLLADTTIRMTEGEIMQIMRKYDNTICEDEYFEIIKLKTARLIASAAKTGAYLGAFSSKQVENISQFGEKMGIAFQLVDDTLDFLAEDKGWGKPLGKDFKEGNLTLPVIRFLDIANLENRGWLSKVIKTRQYDEITMKRVNTLLVENNVFQYCFEKAEKLAEEGKQYISQLSEYPDFAVLHDLADFFIHRSF